MLAADLTLTSPLAADRDGGRPLLALTIVWHPDPSRIGEQCTLPFADQAFEISRYLPAFSRPGGEAQSLGYGGISRDPVRIVADGERYRVTAPDSRMVTELNGAEIRGDALLTHAQIEAGAMLGLGRAVLLCIHWMRCLPKDNPVPGLLGVSSVAIGVRDQIRQAARTDAPVLLLGETGTGKEVAARAVHTLSRRSDIPLVTVNMAALNEALAAADLFGAAKGAYTGAQEARKGLFAEAAGGTLFLDEIGNAPSAVQPMLLRVLESGDYRPLGAQRDERADVRLIAATDQDLYGPSFNQPLLRRLESLVIELPPLRARREDIGVLMRALLAASEADGGPIVALPFAFVSACACHDWPGNVRQLAHVLKRAVLGLRHGQQPPSTLLAGARAARPEESAAAPSAVAAPRRKLADIGEQEVLAAMEQNDWYIQGAALALGVSRPSMYKLLEAHPQVRRPEQIAVDELRQVLEACGGDVETCAARLRTPSEALRRYLRTLGLAA
ncbi:MAG TPA: sigma 54-interacting transcriptional regulator [Burkholderiaceae bacterium]